MLLPAMHKSLNVQRLLLPQQALLSSVASTGIIDHSLQGDCLQDDRCAAALLHTAAHWAHSSALGSPSAQSPHSTCTVRTLHIPQRKQQDDSRLDGPAHGCSTVERASTVYVCYGQYAVFHHMNSTILKFSERCFGVSHAFWHMCGVGVHRPCCPDCFTQ